MKQNLFTILITLMLVTTYCTNSNREVNQQASVLNAKELKVYGRHDLIDESKLELISTAAHFGFTFKGKECKIYVSINNPNGHNYLQYELDGVYQNRIKVSGNDTLPIIIKTEKDTIHNIWIYKCTEAHTGPVFIEKIEGNNTSILELPNRKTIEFIGNSITCGAASDSSEVKCGQGEYHDQHNAYYSYGARLARNIGLNYMVTSVSGIGIYRNWNSDGPTMPQVYENTDLQFDSNRKWDFNIFTPDIVSIALGTNDYSDGDGVKERKPFDPETYSKTYIEFIKLIKIKYPKAQIALLSSPMIDGARRDTLESCLSNIKVSIDKEFPNDQEVAIYNFKGNYHNGCSWHPSVEEHKKMAEELTPFFEDLLK